MAGSGVAGCVSAQDGFLDGHGPACGIGGDSDLNHGRQNTRHDCGPGGAHTIGPNGLACNASMTVSEDPGDPARKAAALSAAL